MLKSSAAWNPVSIFASEAMKSKMEVEWRRRRAEQHSQPATQVLSQVAAAAVAEILSTESNGLYHQQLLGAYKGAKRPTAKRIEDEKGEENSMSSESRRNLIVCRAMRCFLNIFLIALRVSHPQILETMLFLASFVSVSTLRNFLKLAHTMTPTIRVNLAA